MTSLWPQGQLPSLHASLLGAALAWGSGAAPVSTGMAATRGSGMTSATDSGTALTGAALT